MRAHTHAHACAPLVNVSSDDKGLEVESLTLVTKCDKTFLFVGAERTSTIFVFDITDPTKVNLESHISVAGTTSVTPEVSYAKDDRPNRDLGMIDPEMMSFDATRDLLIVSGAYSGSVGVFKVNGLPKCDGNSTNSTKALDAGAPRGASAMPAFYLIAALLLAIIQLPKFE